jgi:hypothetical protein
MAVFGGIRHVLARAALFEEAARIRQRLCWSTSFRT